MNYLLMNSPAERLREARKLRGINQVQLAQKAGVSTGLVGSIESGARGIERAARKLAEALDVDAYWLTSGQGQMTPALMQPPAAPAPTLAQALEVLDTAMQGIAPILQAACKSTLEKWVRGEAGVAATAATLQALQQASKAMPSAPEALVETPVTNPQKS